MRNWRTFSIRTLMLLITACCLGLAWIAAERAQTARETVAAKYFEERDGLLMQGADWAPRKGLLKFVLGDNSAAQHRDAHLNDRKIQDADLAKLQDLPEIDNLFLGNNISDAGLVHLRGHSGITGLLLWESRITDAGLVHLRSIPHLNDVYLDQTLITGAGLIHLEGMRFEHLSLAGTRLRDDELRHLQRLAWIGKLDIAETPITDAGLRHLHSLQSLREVNATLCPVTEAGVDALLAALPDLIVKDRFRPRGQRAVTY